MDHFQYPGKKMGRDFSRYMFGFKTCVSAMLAHFVLMWLVCSSKGAWLDLVIRHDHRALVECT